MLVGRRVIGTVGIPCGMSHCHTAFTWNLLKFAQFNERHLLQPDQDLLYLDTGSTYRYFARNELARKAQGEFLFQLDADHTFGADILKRLLIPFEQYGLDVVTGVYYQRQPPYLPVIYRFRADDDYHCEFITGFPDDTIFRVDCAGAGCLLVRGTVFDRMRAELGEEPFDQYQGTGEDFSFFMRCRKLGIPVHVVPWVQCGHIGQQVFGAQHHEKYLPQLCWRTETVAGLKPDE